MNPEQIKETLRLHARHELLSGSDQVGKGRTMNTFDKNPGEPSALVQFAIVVLIGLAFAAVLAGYCH